MRSAAQWYFPLRSMCVVWLSYGGSPFTHYLYLSLSILQAKKVKSSPFNVLIPNSFENNHFLEQPSSSTSTSASTSFRFCLRVGLTFSTARRLTSPNRTSTTWCEILISKESYFFSSTGSTGSCLEKMQFLWESVLVEEVSEKKFFWNPEAML